MADPVPVPPTRALDAAIAALRYALAHLDQVEREASGAGGSAATFSLPLAAVPALADMAIAARCALAEREGIADPVQQRQAARAVLQSELEAHTLIALADGHSDPAPRPENPAARAMQASLDPVFGAALWDFVAASKDGTAKRSRRDHEFACFLAGAWEEATAQWHVAAEGIPIEQARAKAAELIEAQRALYGSLAAGRGRSRGPQRA